MKSGGVPTISAKAGLPSVATVKLSNGGVDDLNYIIWQETQDKGDWLSVWPMMNTIKKGDSPTAIQVTCDATKLKGSDTPYQGLLTIYS